MLNATSLSLQSFDELVLLKRGGRVIYFGALGDNSQHLVDYLQVRWRTSTHLLTSSRTNVLLCIAAAFSVRFCQEAQGTIFNALGWYISIMSAAFIHLIHYAQGIEGVPKIDEGINPATYALQV